MELAHF